jgi:DNA replication protein DnaC
MEKRKDSYISEAILTNQEFYQLLQKDAQEIIACEKGKMRQRRMFLPLAYSDFQSLFCTFGAICLLNRNQDKNFVIDDNNEPIIKQLYYFATSNPSFVGDLNKGILLQGKYGSGKTILLETYSLLHNHIVRKFSLNYSLLLFIKSLELQEQIRKQSVNIFVRKPLIIDEFGRESKTVQDFGNITRPISELLSLRSDAGTLTHGTTNFILNTLSSDEFYGGMIGDRLRTMFNVITLRGESRRI